MYRIYSGARARYYHPDHAEPVRWDWALTFDDIGEAGYVADQLCERDAGLKVETALGVITIPDNDWRVVDHPRP